MPLAEMGIAAVLKAAESALIDQALRATGGNKTRAAELLGVTDRTLRNKLGGRRRPAKGG